MILRIINRGLTPETYDAIAAQLDIDRRHPVGLIMHGATIDDGVITVAQIWDAESYATEYDQTILYPVLELLGVPLEADVQVFELKHLVTP